MHHSPRRQADPPAPRPLPPVLWAALRQAVPLARLPKPPLDVRTAAVIAALATLGLALSPAADIDPAGLRPWTAYATYAAAHPSLPEPEACQGLLSAPVAGRGPSGDARELSRRCDALQAAIAARGLRTLAMTPGRGRLQPGWLTATLLVPGVGAWLALMLASLLVVPWLAAERGAPVVAALALVPAAAGWAVAGWLGEPWQAAWGCGAAMAGWAGAFAHRWGALEVEVPAAWTAWPLPWDELRAWHVALTMAALPTLGVGLQAAWLVRIVIVFSSFGLGALVAKSLLGPALAAPPARAGEVAAAAQPGPAAASAPTAAAMPAAEVLPAAEATAPGPAAIGEAIATDAAVTAEAPPPLSPAQEERRAAWDPAVAALLDGIAAVAAPSESAAAESAPTRVFRKPAAVAAAQATAAAALPAAAAEPEAAATRVMRRPSAVAAAAPLGSPADPPTVALDHAASVAAQVRSAAGHVEADQARTEAYDPSDIKGLRATLALRAAQASQDGSELAACRDVSLRSRTATGYALVDADGHDLTLRPNELVALAVGRLADLGDEPCCDLYVRLDGHVERWRLLARAVHRARVIAERPGSDGWQALLQELADAAPQAARTPTGEAWPPAEWPRYADGAAMDAAGWRG